MPMGSGYKTSSRNGVVAGVKGRRGVGFANRNYPKVSQGHGNSQMSGTPGSHGNSQMSGTANKRGSNV